MIFKEGNTHYKAFIDELNRHIKTDFTIKLPVNQYDEPDFDYTDEYIEKIKRIAINKINILN